MIGRFDAMFIGIPETVLVTSISGVKCFHLCKYDLTLYLFFLIGIHSMQGWTATTRHGVTEKKSRKRLEHTGNLFKNNLQDVC